MNYASYPEPEESGQRIPPRRRPPTAVGAESPEPEGGYWEVRLHALLPPTHVPAYVPERMVRRMAGSNGSYRFVPEAA